MGVPLGVRNDEVICGFVNKGKRSLWAVQGLSRSGRSMDPEVSSKIYWSVCIPSMLYGVEVLDLSMSHMGKLETAHKQMAKHVQGLPEYTLDPATLSQLCWVSLESFVERKCMLWIWKLLNLDNDNPIRSVTASRMIHFKHKTKSVISRSLVSPLRKIFNIIHRYGLTGDHLSLPSNPLIIPYSSNVSWERNLESMMCTLPIPGLLCAISWGNFNLLIVEVSHQYPKITRGL